MHAPEVSPAGDAPPAASARTRLAVTILLVALYAAARLRHLAATGLWFDEIFSVRAARHAWGELWRFPAADLVYPPLRLGHAG